MDETNPFAPPRSREPAAKPKGAEPSRFWPAVGYGAKLGLKWMMILMGPLAVLTWVAGFSYVLWALASGKGVAEAFNEDARGMLLNPIGFLIVCAGWGVAIGAVVGGLVYVGRRLRSGHRPR